MEEEVGRVTHFYPKISVAVVEMTGTLKVGDKIRVKGSTTDFTQVVESMQIEHKNIKEAKPGDVIGLKVKERTREKDIVYKIIGEE